MKVLKGIKNANNTAHKYSHHVQPLDGVAASFFYTEGFLAVKLSESSGNVGLCLF